MSANAPAITRGLKLVLVPLAVGAAGLVLAHHEMILTGLAFMQNDWGDTRFCNYALEHGYRWLFGWPGHTDLWSPGFFYPAKGVFAYTENLLGVMPLYAVWRLVGFPFDTAFQLWVFTLGALNFTAAYLLFRRCFTVGQLAASVGAALFAYAGIRVNQTMHFQVFPQFFSVVAVHAAYRLLEGELGSKAPRARVAWIAVFFASVTGQLYASIYLGWYLAFALALAASVGLLFATARRRVARLVLAHPLALVAAAGVSAAVLAPLLSRYVEVGKQFGYRPYEEVLTMVPVASAWFDMGPFSWLWGWTNKFPSFRGIPMEHEQRCGFGFVTTAVCGLGYFFGRKTPAVRVMALVLAVLLLVSTQFGGYGGFTLWKWVYAAFPGASAIRAVSRIGILFLIPVGLGVAVALQRFADRGRLGLAAAVALGLASLAEQGQTTPAFDKAQAREDFKAIAAQAGKSCEAFLFSPVQGTGPYWKYQLDAMLASLEAEVPTINGYSGHDPPGWAFTDTNLWGPEQDNRMRSAVGRWVAQNKLDDSKLCWVRLALQEGRYRASVVAASVPRTMLAGQAYEAEVTLRNTGVDVWRPEELFRLGSLAPQDNRTWGMNRLDLPGPVEPGKEAKFRFTIVAPATAGRYPFQWRMLREGQAWFGPATAGIDVEVSAAASSPGP